MRTRRLLTAVVSCASGLLVATGAQAATRPGNYAPAAVNRAAGQRQAARLLTLLTPPVDATPSATDPTPDGALGSVPFDGAGSNTVDADAFYVTADSPAAAIAAVAAHLPAGAENAGTEGGSGDTPQEQEWSLPAVAGVPGRAVAVSVVGLADGSTAVRLDGEADWLQPRARWERVPAGAVSLTFSGRGGANASADHAADADAAGPGSSPVTITRPAAIRRVTRYLNALEVFQPGDYSCPADFGVSTTVTFRGPSGRVLARAIDHPTGCATIGLSVGGRRGAALADSGPAAKHTATLTQELAAAGAIARCRSSQLTIAATDPSSHDVLFTVSDRSRTLCALWGYPRLSLATAGGHRLVAVQHDIPGGDSPEPQDALHSTVLYPRSQASFAVTRDNCAGPVAAAAHVTLPAGGPPLAVSFAGLEHPLRACDRRLAVSPLGSD